MTGWSIDANGQAPPVDIAIDDAVVSMLDGNAAQPEACVNATSARRSNVGFSTTITAPANPGPHEIALRARDAAGNVRVIGRMEVSVQ